MRNIHDEERDMLQEYMAGALGRVIAGLDALDALAEMNAGGYGTWDDWNALGESAQDLLDGLGVELDSDGDWDTDIATDGVREALDPLDITWEKGKPFDVALTLGGPNIYLVDFGGHGGAQLRGHWGGTHVMTGPDVTRAVNYYQEEMRDIYGD